jgi:hypothetical protein
MSIPINKELYNQVKEEADQKFKKPSAYKSGFIVKEYKRRGGDYEGSKSNDGLARWFLEEWSDIGNKDYPVYRPTKKISKDTPLTVKEIDFKNLIKQIKLKQKIKGNKNLPPFKPKK